MTTPGIDNDIPLINQIKDLLPKQAISIILTNFKNEKIAFLTCQVTPQECRLVSGKQHWIYNFASHHLTRNQVKAEKEESFRFSTIINHIIEDIKTDQMTVYEEYPRNSTKQTENDNTLNLIHKPLNQSELNITLLSKEELDKLTCCILIPGIMMSQF